MVNWRSLVIFIAALLILRRFGVQVSILGSLGLTIILSYVIRRIGWDGPTKLDRPNKD